MGHGYCGGLTAAGSNNILIRPFDNNLEIIVKSKRDCFTWLAQVLYSRDGAEDLDGDNLKNGWEDTGYDHNNNGAVDVDLPSYGANCGTKMSTLKRTI